MAKIKTYSELIQYSTFEDRFNYLKMNGNVGEDTFGCDRYLNQIFYKSTEWKKIRRDVICRDKGCDLGMIEREIRGPIYIHHMNPIKPDDFKNNLDLILNPEYLISVSLETHNAIHYGRDSSDITHKNEIIDRSPNDTCPWKRGN